MSIFQQFEDVVAHKAWPFIKSLFAGAVQAEYDALEPIVADLIAEAEHDIVSAFQSGSIADLGHVLGGLVTAAGEKAESAGIAAGASSILTSIGAAIATNPATSEAASAAPASE